MKTLISKNVFSARHFQMHAKGYQKNKSLGILPDVGFKNHVDTHGQLNYNAPDSIIVADDLLSVAARRFRNKAIPKPGAMSCQGEVLYGLHPVYCALKKQRRKPYHLYVKEETFAKRNIFAKSELRKEIMSLATSLGVKTTAVNSQTLKILAQGAVHQGVCLDASSYPLLECSGQDLDYVEAASTEHQLWLLLSEIQDPMNVGAIFRSAYYFGVDKIFMLPHSGCRLSPVVSKASTGALELLTVFLVQDLIAFLQKRKDCGWNIVSTTTGLDENNGCDVLNLKDFQLTKSTVLILGNESRGVPSSVQSLCDHLISIVSEGDHSLVDSLNVSVATGIMLYHLLCRGKI